MEIISCCQDCFETNFRGAMVKTLLFNNCRPKIILRVRSWETEIMCLTDWIKQIIATNLYGLDPCSDHFMRIPMCVCVYVYVSEWVSECVCVCVCVCVSGQTPFLCWLVLVAGSSPGAHSADFLSSVTFPQVLFHLLLQYPLQRVLRPATILHLLDQRYVTYSLRVCAAVWAFVHS